MNRQLPTLYSLLPVLLHSMVWALYLAMIIYVAASQRVPFLLAHPSVHLLSEAMVFYLNYLYFIPRLLGSMKVGRFFLLNLMVIVTLEVISIEIYHGLRRWYLGPGLPDFPLSYPTQLLLRFGELLLFVGLAGVVRFTVDWFTQQQKNKELENAQLRTELALLKSQVNPHFLFNTLNSLYALALKQSPHTPAGIMHLSQLMRYVLYETNEERIYLSKEIETIHHYLDLQKLRLPAHFCLEFQIQGDVGETRIEPLLLLPLVENMFKHGTVQASIRLEVCPKSLLLRTSNGVRASKGEAVGGIGLTNLRRRLEQLYPGHHQLLLEEKEGNFLAMLRLDL